MRQTSNMRSGFTMIELIFVIVIIGILAAVAIPKLAANKDDATASTCMHEFGQLKGEIAQAYAAAKDFDEWKTLKIDDNITNITVNVDEGNGITNAVGVLIHGATVEYMCDSVEIGTITPSLTGTKYGMSVAINTVAITDSPAAQIAATKLLKQQNDVTPKVYRF